ncbi:DNA replication/repair protein RecF [Fodinisporobacter ferrooxydans]|uniref:DNA replication and repair protein RecF n=1 Tax=Fodinisporobacter ferrooxydans TaxID=2901836 RepID=A0ABY4CMT5_9BACL|nr:DNA replication/repair protein RecF [Alicyclobacillaceae bacterium MYW30-H2]
MFVTALQAKQFRNYQSLAIEFSPTANLIVGQNAQGKTNILEAILMLAVAKSHRTNKDQEMIRWGSEKATISASINRSERRYKLELDVLKKGKRALINGVEKRKMSDFVGHLNIVLFAPEDLTLVKGSPQIRRKFMDLEIAQMSPKYLYHLSQYQKVLQQRNSILKNGQQQSIRSIQPILAVWDEQIIEHGIKVIRKRYEFIHKLQKYANQIHQQISGGREDLSLSYVSSIPIFLPDTTCKEEMNPLSAEQMREVYINQLEQRMPQDLQRGSTSIGPHRDDVQVSIHDKPVDIYGSQGQQRTAALSMKLAEIDLIKEEVGEYPILLLDDVLSELDEQRQQHLVKSMGEKVQTFITATTTYGLEIFLKNHAEVFSVNSGIITKEG